MLLSLLLVVGVVAFYTAFYFLLSGVQKVLDSGVSSEKLKNYLLLANGEVVDCEEKSKFKELVKKYSQEAIVNATAERISNKILSGYTQLNYETNERATVYHDKISTSIIEYEGERDDRYYTVYGGENLNGILEKCAVARAISTSIEDELKDKFLTLFGKEALVETKATSCVVTRTNIKERVIRVSVKVAL